jgi:M-phase inducer tyrosine phosphatase
MAPSRQPRQRPRGYTTTRPPGLAQKFAHHRHSTGTIPEEPDEMPLFARTIPALKLTAHPNRDDEINAFLSSDVHAQLDLEDSFASTMSLNSPPQARRQVGLPDTPADESTASYEPMDISPAPQRVFHAAPPPKQANAPYYRSKTERERDNNHTLQLPLPAASSKAGVRPRSNTATNTRLFGTDVSNATIESKKPDDKSSEKEKNGRKLQRSALPFEWVSSVKDTSSSVSN